MNFPRELPLNEVSKISAGSLSSAAIVKGVLYIWGSLVSIDWKEYVPTKATKNKSLLILFDNVVDNFVDVALGKDHCIALRNGISFFLVFVLFYNFVIIIFIILFYFFILLLFFIFCFIFLFCYYFNFFVLFFQN